MILHTDKHVEQLINHTLFQTLVRCLQRHADSQDCELIRSSVCTYSCITILYTPVIFLCLWPLCLSVFIILLFFCFSSTAITQFSHWGSIKVYFNFSYLILCYICKDLTHWSLRNHFNSNVGVIFSHILSLSSCFYRRVDLQVRLRVSATCCQDRRAQLNPLRSKLCPRFTFLPPHKPYETYCRWTISHTHTYAKNI